MIQTQSLRAMIAKCEKGIVQRGVVRKKEWRAEVRIGTERRSDCVVFRRKSDERDDHRSIIEVVVGRSSTREKQTVP